MENLSHNLCTNSGHCDIFVGRVEGERAMHRGAVTAPPGEGRGSKIARGNSEKASKLVEGPSFVSHSAFAKASL